MADGLGRQLLKSRLLMWLIFSVFLVICLSLISVAPFVGYSLVVVAIIGMLLVVLGIRRTDEAVGEVHDRTRCQFCGALLQGFAGMRRSTCGQCGKDQPWSRGSSEQRDDTGEHQRRHPR